MRSRARCAALAVSIAAGAIAVATPPVTGSAFAAGTGFDYVGPRHDFATSGTTMRIHLPGHGAHRAAYVQGRSWDDLVGQVGVRFSSAPRGANPALGLAVRHSASGEYRVQVNRQGKSRARLTVARVSAGGTVRVLSRRTLALRVTARGALEMAVAVSGQPATQIDAAIWRAGTSRPTHWQLAVNDRNGLPAGAAGLVATDPRSTRRSATVTFSRLDVTSTDASAPAPTSPLAVTPTTTSAPTPTSPSESTSTPSPASTTTQTVSTAASVAAGAGADPVGTASYPVPANAYFVATNGSDSNPGTLLAPWATLHHAVTAAPNGATIVVRAGTYHDSVVFPYGKQLTIQNFPDEAVWLDGSQPVTGWTQSGGVWAHSGWTFAPDSTDPTAGNTTPGWQMVNPAHPMAAHPDEVFYDGNQLQQVGSLDEVQPGTFYVDTANQTLYLGSDPTGHLVEASTLTEAIYINGGTGSIVRGIGIRRYATPIERYGTVKAFADDVTLENLVVADNAVRGIGVQGTDVTLSHDTVTDNGQLGIGAYQSDGLHVLDSVIDDNNTQQFNVAPEAGGMKLSSCRDIVLDGNVVTANLASGIWVDESSYDATITRNDVEQNVGNGIQIEISGFATIADNLVVANAESGVQVDEANDVNVWNNLLDDNAIDLDVIDGPRVASNPSTPGHDSRYPDDPNVTWIVRDIVVRNNVLADATGPEMWRVDDSSHMSTAAEMVSADYDAFYRTMSADPATFVTWANYGSSPPVLAFANLSSFVRSTGQEAHGLAVDGAASDPFVDAATWLPAPVVTAAGDPLSPAVAAALGLPAGAAAPIGLL